MKTKLMCVLLLCFLTFSTTPAVHAQGSIAGIGMSAMQKAAKVTEWMKKNLNLSADQIPLVKNLNEKYAKLAEKITGSSKSSAEKTAELKSQGEKQDGELKGILNANQFATWLAKKGELEAMFKNNVKL